MAQCNKKVTVEQHTGQDAECQRGMIYLHHFFRHEDLHFTVTNVIITANNHVPRCYDGAIPVRQREL